MPGPWNDQTDKQLLLSVIHLTAPQLSKWDQVANLMGEGFTAESTRQHFQKLRKECKAQFGEPGTGTPSKTTAAATPSKSTPRQRGGTKASASKRKKIDEEADDDEESESPVKKVKKEKMEAKEESGDGDGDEFV